LPGARDLAVLILLLGENKMLASPTTAHREIKPLKVLVAEDDASAREILDQVMRRLGHACRTARDGHEAWAMHRANRADLVLSDWKIPKLDGLELCRRIRDSDAPHWHTHFILMTGRNDRPCLVDGLNAGADEYVTKPIDLAELEARLEAARRVVTMRRALQAANLSLRRDSARDYKAARTDPLTAVSNRRRLKEDLEPLQGRASRYGHRYCAALCDIDMFKSYNDAFGHQAGDDALCRVAATIQAHLRSGDTLYRYGGEEFLVLLPEQSLDHAVVGANRVRQEVERLHIKRLPFAPKTFLTLSAGVAELGGGSVEDWLRRADEALYRAKALGRNRVEVAAGDGARR
jgi:two-component system cell cycle response regulator